MDIRITDLLYRGVNHVEDLGRTSRWSESSRREEPKASPLESQLDICKKYKGLLNEAQARSFCREFISTYDSGFRRGRRADQAMREYEKLMKPREKDSEKVFLKQGLVYIISTMHKRYLSPVED